ncbi:hypothetical protein Bbelb_318240 [Branchiostoma belcheri]|nr:hypothetical protein Bbelb_318240 [Branchiostoma belcheri]
MAYGHHPLLGMMFLHALGPKEDEDIEKRVSAVAAHPLGPRFKPLRQARSVVLVLRSVVDSKEEIVSDVLLWAPKHGHASVGRPCPTYIQHLCEDAGCRLEDLPRTMEDREGGRESQASVKLSRPDEIMMMT